MTAQDRKTTLLLTEAEISDRLNVLAKEISRDYEGKELILVGILKGSLMILADLARELWKEGLEDFEIDFIGIQSYGSNTETSKNPQIVKDLSLNIRDRHVLIVEDVVDSGYSLAALDKMLKQRGVASLETCVLLSKESRREVDVRVKYIGFQVDGWVEGYGMDSDEKFRGRPNVVVIEE